MSAPEHAGGIIMQARLAREMSRVDVVSKLQQLMPGLRLITVARLRNIEYSGKVTAVELDDLSKAIQCSWWFRGGQMPPVGFRLWGVE